MASKARTQQMSPVVSLLSVAILLILLPTISAVYPSNASPNASDFIHTNCGATLYPDLCYTSLSPYNKSIHNSRAQLARIAIAISLSRARRLASYVSNLARQTNSGTTEPRTVAALNDCFSTFGDAVDQMRQSLTEMRKHGTGESFQFRMSNIQTWMSAALTNEDTCTDGFQEVSDTKMKVDVCDKTLLVQKITSNALALVNSYVEKGKGTVH